MGNVQVPRPLSIRIRFRGLDNERTFPSAMCVTNTVLRLLGRPEFNIDLVDRLTDALAEAVEEGELSASIEHEFACFDEHIDARDCRVVAFTEAVQEAEDEETEDEIKDVRLFMSFPDWFRYTFWVDAWEIEIPITWAREHKETILAVFNQCGGPPFSSWGVSWREILQLGIDDIHVSEIVTVGTREDDESVQERHFESFRWTSSAKRHL